MATNQWILLIALLVAGLSLTGCGQQEDSARQAGKEINNTVKRVTKDVEDAQRQHMERLKQAD